MVSQANIFLAMTFLAFTPVSLAFLMLPQEKLRRKMTTSLAALSTPGSSSSSWDRRGLLATAATGMVAAATGIAGVGKNQDDGLMVSSSSFSQTDTSRTLESIEEIVKLLETQGNKRFLQAVVASEYKLLYSYDETIPDAALVSMTQQDLTPPKTNLQAPDVWRALLDADTSSSSSFHKTRTRLIHRGRRTSFWPLGEDIHFAWTEDEHDMLWTETDTAITASSSFSRLSLIIDGVDCGLMSLEDALERVNGQVLVYADSYVEVPASMEQKLVKALKGSFII